MNKQSLIKRTKYNWLFVMLFGPFPLRLLEAVSPPVKPLNFLISMIVLIKLTVESYNYINSVIGI